MALVAQHSISIIFPAYSEEDNILQAVEQAIHCVKPLFQDWEVIIVNDGSQDKTGMIIDSLAEQNPRITALHHASNQGYGAALKTGIQQAQKELIFCCDSDLQFHLNELLLLLTWIEQYDIVVGYRAKLGASTARSRSRFIVSRISASRRKSPSVLRGSSQFSWHRRLSLAKRACYSAAGAPPIDFVQHRPFEGVSPKAVSA
jgi:glycosyltransferase involved in cell wall biosynthesis